MSALMIKPFAAAVSGSRLYRVRPASSEGDWFAPDTHTYYLEITRLSDGRRLHTWRARDWRDADSWAHAKWECWRRAGWIPEFQGRQV